MKSEKTHWKTAFIYLLILAPLFFLIYGFGNTYTAGLPPEKVKEICFSWEKNIPFLSWTILPYWSIDLLYGLSLFLPMTKFALRQHALRLLTATPIAVFFFCLFPLTFSTPRPETTGVWKFLFDFLMGFDKPYNQAPSLHIILLIIIWRIYLPHFGQWMKWFWNFWCILIGVSVLTTFQHHFIDIPPAIALGIVICYIFPLDNYCRWRWEKIKSGKLSAIYLAGFLLFAVIPLFLDSYGGFLLWWLSFSCLMIALGYLGLFNVFQKKENGHFSFAAGIIFFPFRMLNRLIRYFFFPVGKEEREISEGIFLGPVQAVKNTRCSAVLDLCGEYSRQADIRKAYQSIPIIDLAVLNQKELSQSVQALDEMHEKSGTVLVHCALGLSRSVSVVSGWLIFSGKADSVDEALELLKQKKYSFVLSPKHIKALNEYRNTIKTND